MMYAFALALQFLTRIPIPVHFIATDKQLGQSVLFYPAVGLLMGAILYLSALALNNVATGLEAAVLLTAWVWLSGGLHLDGLADCADAWVGGLGSRERSLEIMKDPAAGPWAVVVLVLVLLLKWSALSSLPAARLPILLLIIPMLGRVAMVLLMLSTRYIRKAGLGEKLVRNVLVRPAWIVSVVCMLAAVPVIGPWPVVVVGIVTIMVRYWAIQRLGGVTGDVYGACVELAETTALVAAALYA